MDVDTGKGGSDKPVEETGEGGPHMEVTALEEEKKKLQDEVKELRNRKKKAKAEFDEAFKDIIQLRSEAAGYERGKKQLESDRAKLNKAKEDLLRKKAAVLDPLATDEILKLT